MDKITFPLPKLHSPEQYYETFVVNIQEKLCAERTVAIYKTAFVKGDIEEQNVSFVCLFFFFCQTCFKSS